MPVPNGEKAFSLQQVYQVIESVCRAHVSVAHFDSGTESEFGNNKEYSYPLAYLEEILLIQEGEQKRTHTYDVALNICDQLPKNCSREKRIEIQDGCFRTFLDISQYLTDYAFGSARVFPFTVAVTPDFGNDDTMRIRAEFRIQVGSPFTTRTPRTDLKALFPTLP